MFRLKTDNIFSIVLNLRLVVNSGICLPLPPDSGTKCMHHHCQAQRLAFCTKTLHPRSFPWTLPSTALVLLLAFITTLHCDVSLIIYLTFISTPYYKFSSKGL